MMKTIETHEMKEDSTRKRMENIEKSDITYPSVQALGELYLVGFIFASNMKLSPWFGKVYKTKDHGLYIKWTCWL